MNQRLSEVGSKRHIPSDLWPDMLSRLPVKSLLRFRCVSKSWLGLVDDDEFARLHLKNFKNNCDETHLFAVEGQQRKCVVRSSDSFEINSETLLTLGNSKRRRRNQEKLWEFDCSIDGLIVLRKYRRGCNVELSDLKVWNPSIRKFYELPSLPALPESITETEHLRDPDWSHIDIGLGYDPLAKVYKYVKLVFLNYYNVHSVAIYTLGAGTSWKIIKFQCKDLSSFKWHFNREGIYQRVFFQGRFYFIGKDVLNDRFCDLVAFDLSSEVFSCVRKPDNPHFKSDDGFKWWEVRLFNCGSSLAMVDDKSSEKSVWVLENTSGESEAMYWTKRYSFDLKFLNFLYLRKNGDILTRKCRRENLAAAGESGKKSFVMWDQVTSYRPETDEFKIVQEKRGSMYEFNHICSYVESLILHKMN